MGKNRNKKLLSGKVRNITENDEDPENGNKRHIASDFDDTATDIKKNKRLKRHKKLNEENSTKDNVKEQLNDDLIDRKSVKLKRKKDKMEKVFVTTTGLSDVDGNDGSNEIGNDGSSNSVPKQKKRKKNNKELNQNNNEIDCEGVQSHPQESKIKAKKNMSVGKDQMSTANTNKCNKIRFIDDVPVEVNADTMKPKVKTQNMNDEEALVNDEEIDRFCDEIGDEDNVQYENWVKLLEAKLGKNKK